MEWYERRIQGPWGKTGSLVMGYGMLRVRRAALFPAGGAQRRCDGSRGGEAIYMARHHLAHPRREEFIERFRHLHLRVTPQRLLVIEALASQSGHMTADEIMRWAAARYPAINLATIYRTLDLLTSVGLVTQTDLRGGAIRFELVGETRHHHLVCERCGAVTEVDDALFAPVRERLLRDFGFRTDARHLALFGLCAGCLTTGREQERAPEPEEEAAPGLPADAARAATPTRRSSALPPDWSTIPSGSARDAAGERES
jgi:Fur family transcriptional regulator, ferric uptake regulator